MVPYTRGTEPWRWALRRWTLIRSFFRTFLRSLLRRFLRTLVGTFFRAFVRALFLGSFVGTFFLGSFVGALFFGSFVRALFLGSFVRALFLRQLSLQSGALQVWPGGALRFFFEPFSESRFRPLVRCASRPGSDEGPASQLSERGVATELEPFVPAAWLLSFSPFQSCGSQSFDYESLPPVGSLRRATALRRGGCDAKSELR